MKDLFFKGVKLHPAMAEKVVEYAEKAYRCSYEQLSMIEQYDSIMAAIDEFNDAQEVYFDRHPDLVVASVRQTTLTDMVNKLKLTPQDSYYQW